MSDATLGTVDLEIVGDVAWVRFNRPTARNAMSKVMYAQFEAHLDHLATRADIRVAVFRGVGGSAFVAGSDIASFDTVQTGADGVDYERRIGLLASKIASLPMPTIAVIEGWAVGGGLNTAALCDLRICTPDAKFGVPIARTLGNTLSQQTVSGLVEMIGVARAKRMLLLADFLTADEALAAGFVVSVVEPEGLDAAVEDMCARLRGHAPVTMRVLKEMINRAVSSVELPDDRELIETVYGSDDFREGVSAFVARRKPEWRNR